ncbi:MAG: hypothetical protein GEU79_06290 [Acidimicrobiia bacterium]|nr:hypothetical protein [Acidimicrobiia bacterium]
MASTESTRIIAHRGASIAEPENTMRAFRAAAEQGADMVEVDVRLSADGHPVVHHKAEVGSNGARPRVESLDLATLTAMCPEAPIPALEEVLSWAQGRIGVYLDLKARGAGGSAMGLVRDLEMTDEVIAGSFHPGFVAEVRATAPTVATSILMGPQQPNLALPLATELRTRYVHPCWETAHPTPHKLLNADFRHGARAAGLGIISWQEDRPEELHALLDLGVDGICTNRPDRLAALRG